VDAPDDGLWSWYDAATALVITSRYEGFGLPVLEAMRLGTPVVTSRTSSLPEIAGDAALCERGTIGRPTYRIVEVAGAEAGEAAGDRHTQAAA